MSKGFESSLFDYSHLDDYWYEKGTYVFDDVVLKVQIGKFPSGTKFPFAQFDLDTSTVEFFYNDTDKSGEKFSFELKIVEVAK